MAENEGNKFEGPGGMDAKKSGLPDSKVDSALKELGIKFKDKKLLLEYYDKLDAVFIADAMLASHGGMVLDLNSLPNAPIPFKDIFIMWLIEINMPRIESGQPPIITYDLISRCPLWKIIRPPLKRLTMTREGLFSKTKTPANIGKKSKMGSINKR
jgi:hypothetical protein